MGGVQRDVGVYRGVQRDAGVYMGCTERCGFIHGWCTEGCGCLTGGIQGYVGICKVQNLLVHKDYSKRARTHTHTHIYMSALCVSRAMTL